MIEIEKAEQDRREEFLFAAALCLIVGVVLLVAAAIIASGRVGSALSTRNRIELVAQSANIYSAGLLLGAVAALTFLGATRIARARPLVVITLIVGTALVLLATYTVVDVLTVHIPSASGNDSFTIGLSNGGSLSERLGGMLPAVGAAFIGIVALVGANRLGRADGRPSIEDFIE